MSRLLPCSGCGRHVHASGEACPFCGASVTEPSLAPSRVIPRVQLTRAALFAGATVLAAACGGAESGGADEPDPNGNSFVQPYGAPATDTEDNTVAPPYGAPPVEDEPADDSPPEE